MLGQRTWWDAETVELAEVSSAAVVVFQLVVPYRVAFLASAFELLGLAVSHQDVSAAELEQSAVDQVEESLAASAPQEGGAAWSLPGAASFAHEGASLASVG